MRAKQHVAELIARKTAVYQAMIAERDVLYPGAEKFVRDCAQRFPLMIATGTLRVEAETILRRAGLRELFLDIIAAEDVERGKPEPDGFIAALGRIGISAAAARSGAGGRMPGGRGHAGRNRGGASRGHEGAGAMPHGAGERAGGGRRRARLDFQSGSRRRNPRTQRTMMAAKLYQFLGSPFCAKVRKLLAFKGVEFEVVEVDYLERKELLLASGQITVPAVTLDNGETIVDSARIAMRLEELYPEPTIFPAGWRGMHLALADYIDNHLEESVYPARARRRARVLQQARVRIAARSGALSASASSAKVSSIELSRINRPTGSAFAMRSRRSRSNSATCRFSLAGLGWRTSRCTGSCSTWRSRAS